MIAGRGRRPSQGTTLVLMERAREAVKRPGIPYWDAAILEEARAGGCTEPLSEDLVYGWDAGSLRVVNPSVQ